MVVSKVATAVKHPGSIMPYIKSRAGDLKFKTIAWQASEDYCTIDLEGYSLRVNLSDYGISRDLVLQGVREPITSEAYRRKLRELNERKSEPLRIAEIGANIGYYALIPPADIDDVEVYAAEVSSENVSMLKHNIEQNGVSDSFTTDCIAIGAEDGEMEVQLSEHSNCHSLQEAAKDKSDIVDSETIRVKRGESWLNEHGLSPTELDVLRMDTEGYESSILRGLPDLDVDLAHIEVHPALMSDDEVSYLIERLDELGLEIVAAAQDEQKIDLQNLAEIREHRWVEIVLY